MSLYHLCLLAVEALFNCLLSVLGGHCLIKISLGQLIAVIHITRNKVVSIKTDIIKTFYQSLVARLYFA